MVGNFDQAKLDAWIDQYFAPAEEPGRADQAGDDGQGARAHRGRASSRRLWPQRAAAGGGACPGRRPAAADPDAPALTVLDAILSAGKSSRLYNSLVYDQQIAAEAFSNADNCRRTRPVHASAPSWRAARPSPQGETALLAQVARLRDAPAHRRRAVRGQERAAGRRGARVARPSRAAASPSATPWRSRATPTRANTELAKLQAVTAADVQRVAAKVPGRRPPHDHPLPARAAEAGRRARPRPPRPRRKWPRPPTTARSSPWPPRPSARTRRASASRCQPVLPKPAEKTLANGLRVIVARSSDLPLVTADLTVRSGAWADPTGLAGAANLTAGHADRGHQDPLGHPGRAPPDRGLGASLSSGGGLESSSVTLSVIADKAGRRALAIMADVARDPAFAAEELERAQTRRWTASRVAYQQPGAVAGFAAAARDLRRHGLRPRRRRHAPARCQASSPPTSPGCTPRPCGPTTPSWC